MRNNKIIIADDSMYQRRLLRRILEPQGFDVHSAQDGWYALEMVERLNPLCVITDILMPGLSGIGLLEAMEERAFKNPVIVCTADVQQTTRARCMALGAVMVLPKPIDQEVLLKYVMAIKEAQV